MTTFLATHLWQSTLFVGVAALLTLVLRVNQARTRYLIWLAASLKFLVPFAGLVAIGRQFAWRTADALPHPALAVVELVSAPFTAEDVAAVAVTAGRVAPPAAAVDFSTSLIAIWMAGVLFLLAVWCARWRKISATQRTATPATNGREVAILRRLERAYGTRELPLLVSDASLEPGVVGCLRPVILWPSSISRHMSDQQIEAILLHELAHVRRRDNLLGLIHMFVQAVCWFHPLVWWIGARLVDERERACDEEVVRFGADPHQYAEGILRTCEYAMPSPLTCVAGVTGSDLKRRVVAIVRNRPAARLGRAKLALLTTVGLLCAIGPFAAGTLARSSELLPPIAERAIARMDAIADMAAAVGTARDEATIRLEMNTTAPTLQPRTEPTPASEPAALTGSSTESVSMTSVRRTRGDGPGDAAFPPTLTRMLAQTASGGQSAAPGAQSAAPTVSDSNLKFEVASIKLNKDTGGAAVAVRNTLGQGTRPGAIFNHAGSVRALLQRAYGIPYVQQIGGPDWIREDTYIINARSPEDAPGTPAALTAMIRALLADRFKLVVREEVREVPIYALTLARADRKLGPKLQLSTCPAPGSGQPPTFPPNQAGLQWDRGPRCGQIQSTRGQLMLGGFPINRLGELLQFELGRPVEDRTGLTGDYVLEMNYTPQALSAAGVVDDAAPSIFSAIQEQLGLKLESQRGPMKVLVIDSIQRPTED